MTRRALLRHASCVGVCAGSWLSSGLAAEPAPESVPASESVPARGAEARHLQSTEPHDEREPGAVAPGAAAPGATAPQADDSLPAAPQADGAALDSLPAAPQADGAALPAEEQGEREDEDDDAFESEESPRGPRHRFEWGGSVGPTIFLGEPAHPDSTSSFSRMGVFAELTFAYHPRYFLSPQLGLSYAELARGGTELPMASGSSRHLGQHLAVLGVTPALLCDWGPVRLRGGLGFTVALLRSASEGEIHETSQFGLSSELGVDVAWVTRPRFASVVGLRYVEAPGLDLRYFGLSLGMRGDVLVLE